MLIPIAQTASLYLQNLESDNAIKFTLKITPIEKSLRTKCFSSSSTYVYKISVTQMQL